MVDAFNVAKSLNKLRGFVGKKQLSVMEYVSRGEEKQFMVEKLSEFADRVNTMPKTYEQDGLGDNAVAHLHYFKDGMDWYITEKDMEPEQHQAFGMADLGLGSPELGYISITEITEEGAELDLFFAPTTIGKIKEMLHSLGKLAMAATVALTLSACATIYDKPDNVSPAKWNSVSVECNNEAARVPVVLVPVYNPATYSNVSSCNKHGCTEYGTYTPPSIQQEDINAPRRDQTRDTCFTNFRSALELKP